MRIDHSCLQFYAKIHIWRQVGSSRGNDQCSTCNVFVVSQFWFQRIVFLELFTADPIRNLEMTNAPLRVHNSAEIYPWVGTQRVEKLHSSGPNLKHSLQVLKCMSLCHCIRYILKKVQISLSSIKESQRNSFKFRGMSKILWTQVQHIMKHWTILINFNLSFWMKKERGRVLLTEEWSRTH